MIGGARRQFPDGGNAAQQLVERSKRGFELAVNLREYGCVQQFASRVVVPFAQGAREIEGGRAVAISRGPRHVQQLVRYFGHGADHNHGLFGYAPLDDGSGAVEWPPSPALRFRRIS